MKLTCQSCGIELHSGDVDFDVLRARCRHCGWEFGSAVSIGPYRRPGSAIVSGEATAADRSAVHGDETRDDELGPLADSPSPPDGALAVPQEAIPLPTHVTVAEWPDGPLRVEIRRRSFGAVALGLCAALGWTGYVSALLLDGSLPGWGAVLLLISAAFAYVALALGLNRTSVLVAGDQLLISHHPLWWPARTIPAREISQLYVAVAGGAVEPGRYELRAITTASDVPLVTGLSQPQPALYLEQKIEERLGIVNRPVRDEVSPID